MLFLSLVTHFFTDIDMCTMLKHMKVNVYVYQGVLRTQSNI